MREGTVRRGGATSRAGVIEALKLRCHCSKNLWRTGTTGPFPPLAPRYQAGEGGMHRSLAIVGIPNSGFSFLIERCWLFFY